MELLILGGTRFLGRHLVEAELGSGHRVTLFNQGLSGPRLFPDVERLVGDRDGDLSALRGRRWAAAIDPCGYVPRLVRASASLLADAVDHYAFVSSISVYSEPTAPGERVRRCKNSLTLWSRRSRVRLTAVSRCCASGPRRGRCRAEC